MSRFTKAVESNTEGMDFLSVGTCPGCDECTDSDEEGHFSWSSCDTCGSSLGGDRYVAHGKDADGNLIHLDVCVDCLQYIANGDEPEQWQAD